MNVREPQQVQYIREGRLPLYYHALAIVLDDWVQVGVLAFTLGIILGTAVALKLQ